MGVLDLARVLENLAAGRAGSGKGGTPLPTIAVVAPEAFAHQRLLACCAAIVAVVAAPAKPRTLTILVRQSGAGPADAQDGALWFGLTEPVLPEPRPELCGLLVALDSAVKLQDAAAALSISRATLFRRLDIVCAALAITRPKQCQLAEHWLKTLLEALNVPVEPAGSTQVPHEP
jgi:hypothetical protein